VSKGIRVTVEDLETGETESKVIGPGDFIFIPVAPCYLGPVQRYPKAGTTMLTVKDHRPQVVDGPKPKVWRDRSGDEWLEPVERERVVKLVRLEGKPYEGPSNLRADIEAFHGPLTEVTTTET
jgi:hypothetical protein